MKKNLYLLLVVSFMLTSLLNCGKAADEKISWLFTQQADRASISKISDKDNRYKLTISFGDSEHYGDKTNTLPTVTAWSERPYKLHHKF